MTARTKLRETLTVRFVPELQRRGFAGPERISGNTLIHNFRRPSKLGTSHLMIQFDKRQRPFFILSLQIEPAEGFDFLEKEGGSVLRGVVRARGAFGFGGWFRADRPWWQRIIGRRSTKEEEAVSEALSYLDAIEDWFAAPRHGTPVRMFTLNYPGIEKTPNQAPEPTAPSGRGSS